MADHQRLFCKRVLQPDHSVELVSGAGSVFSDAGEGKYRSIRETELEELRQSIGSCVTSDQVQLRVETEKQDKTEVLVMTDLTEAAAVSLQVNGLWFYTQPLDSVKAVFEIPDSVLRGKGKYNCIQARLVGGYGAYLVNPYGTVEGDYTNAISNYTYLSR